MYLYMYCEIYVVGDAGVRDGGHSGGNGDDTNSKYSDFNLNDGGAGDITIKKKSNYT
jgi:hypothetical protein